MEGLVALSPPAGAAEAQWSAEDLAPLMDPDVVDPLARRCALDVGPEPDPAALGELAGFADEFVVDHARPDTVARDGHPGSDDLLGTRGRSGLVYGLREGPGRRGVGLGQLCGGLHGL